VTATRAVRKRIVDPPIAMSTPRAPRVSPGPCRTANHAQRTFSGSPTAVSRAADRAQGRQHTSEWRDEAGLDRAPFAFALRKSNVSNAQIPVIARGRAEWVKSTRCCPSGSAQHARRTTESGRSSSMDHSRLRRVGSLRSGAPSHRAKGIARRHAR
jgi:hypothetical protein